MAPSGDSAARVILTRKGEEIVVDAEDFEALSQFTWCVTHWGYASRALPRNGAKVAQRVLMHRQIMGLEKGNPVQVDHKNHNKLDNRRSNLRFATAAQNIYNQRVRSGTRSGVKGVYFSRRRSELGNKCWEAYICRDNTHVCLGWYKTLEEASIRRRQVAEFMHCEYVNHG